MLTPTKTIVLLALAHSKRLAKGFHTGTSGSAAVEFAIISTCMFLALFFLFGVGMVIFLGQQLDYATTKAARQVMTGYVQKNSLSQSAFRTQVVCSYLSAAFSCSDVIVNLQTATQAVSPGGYYAFIKSDKSGLILPTLSNSSTQYSTGVQGSYEYLQVLYPITFLPSMVANLLSNGNTYNGVPAYVAVSTTAFRNEQY